MTSSKRRRPSSFLVGLVILSTCLISFYTPLRPALLDLDDIDTSRGQPLPSCRHLVLIASFLNSASHMAVILNLLEDTMIISILIGVSFDVLSELLYLSFWVQLSQRITLPTTFVLLYATYATYHLTVHVRALLMTRSFRRLESVVRSAYRNIIGYPGDSCYVDHFFAFLDTAFHLFHLGVVSVHVVGLGKSAQIIGAAVMVVMLLALIGAGFAGGNWPSDSGRSNSNGGIPSEQLSTRNTLSRRGDQPICSCKTCGQLAGSASGRTPRATAFCIRVRGLSLSVCDLWQKTFREALSMIDDCNALAATDAKAQ